MLQRALFLLLIASVAFAANIRLYLKDGDYQMVREYKVDGDRVRFLSADRGDWEEIPLDLIDLKKTEQEAKQKEVSLAKTLALEKAEEDAIRADRRLVASVPDKPGAFLIEGGKLTPITESEVTIEDSKSRRILQILAPAPIIASKSTVTIAGKASKHRIADPNPEFFFRLDQEERFALIKLDPKKDERVVEIVNVLPNEAGVVEDMKQVPVFKKQHDVRLHRVWPETPLEPGEYALVEFTEGKFNIRVWDFAVDKK